MAVDLLDGVNAFLAVAECASFTAAAARLGVTPTAVSKTIRLLERRHGVMLFQRTTRKVALTEAGAELFRRLRPAATDIVEAFGVLGDYRQRPMGTLRITMPRLTSGFLLGELVAQFRRDFPDIVLDLSMDDALVDLVAGGYDAGIRLGESVAKDMVAVRLTPKVTWSIVGSPIYLSAAGRPRTPEDLIGHECIRFRFSGSRTIHRWEFKRGKREYFVDVDGGLITNDRALLMDFACRGLGLAYVSDREAQASIANQALEPLLQAYIPSDTGLFLYFPKRSQAQPKLRAFIDAIRRTTL